MMPDYPSIFSLGSVNRIVNVSLGLAAMWLGRRIWRPFEKDVKTFQETYLAFRDAALRLSETSVFVDGTKSLTRVLVNQSICPAHETRMIHLVRDPRAFHASNMKKSGAGFDPQETAAVWKSKHRAICGFAKLLPEDSYLRVRYEDLCGDPRRTMRRVLTFLGATQEDVVSNAGSVGDQHVIGHHSKSRFTGEIRNRESWKRMLDENTCRMVLQETEPYSSRFEYVASD